MVAVREMKENTGCANLLFTYSATVVNKLPMVSSKEYNCDSSPPDKHYYYGITHGNAEQPHSFRAFLLRTLPLRISIGWRTAL